MTYMEELLDGFQTIDLYDLFTDDELDQVTDIALEALARERGITPEVFQIETNIIMETAHGL